MHASCLHANKKQKKPPSQSCFLRQVAEEAVQRHANDSSVNWLDHGTEHPHRIALSVHTSSLQDCLTHLRHGFQHHDVQVCRPDCPSLVCASLHLVPAHGLRLMHVQGHVHMDCGSQTCLCLGVVMLAGIIALSLDSVSLLFFT